jgi:indole-3-glycerol phosphate synthase
MVEREWNLGEDSIDRTAVLTDFLEQVAAERKEHVTKTKPVHSEEEVIGSFPENAWTRARREGREAAADGATDAFTSALLQCKRERRLGVIAEIKRVSPAEGALAPDLDPAKLARAYEAAGATAISVLTEPNHWKGSLDDLARVRDAVSIPILCKDVIVTEYQVLEARARGADAVLLIADLLNDHDLARITKRAKEFDVGVLVEAHERAGFERAVAFGERVVGVNARNLRQPKEIDRDRIEQLQSLARPEQVLVAESGIASTDDARRLPGRVDAVLVGSALVRAADPRSLVEGLAAIRR